MTAALSKKQKLEQLEPLFKFPRGRPSEHSLRLLDDISQVFLKATTNFNDLKNMNEFDSTSTSDQQKKYLALTRYAEHMTTLLKSSIQTASTQHEKVALEHNLVGALLFFLVYLPISETFSISILQELSYLLPTTSVLSDNEIASFSKEQGDTGLLCEGIILLLSKGKFAEAHYAFENNCKYVPQDDMARAIAEQLRAFSTLGMKDLETFQLEQQQRVRQMDSIH